LLLQKKNTVEDMYYNTIQKKQQQNLVASYADSLSQLEISDITELQLKQHLAMFPLVEREQKTGRLHSVFPSEFGFSQ
jgi:hypothetical protein